MMSTTILINRFKKQFVSFLNETKNLIKSISIENYSTVNKIKLLKKYESIQKKYSFPIYDEIKVIIRMAYNDSKRKSIKLLKKKRYEKEMDETIHNKAMRRIIDNIMKSVFRVMESQKKTFKLYLNFIEKAHNEYKKAEASIQEFDSDEFEDEIDEVVAKGLKLSKRITKTGFEYESHKSLGEIKKDLLELFQKQFGNFDTILINNRMYQTSKYLDMVARTNIIRTYTEGTINTCLQWGDDLVKFSQHASPCEICAPLEGEIFSISGKSTEYEQLTDDVTPPVHPNCEHGLNPV